MWKEKIAGILHYFLEKKDIESMDPWNLLTGTKDFSERSRAWDMKQRWPNSKDTINGLTIAESSIRWNGIRQIVSLPKGVYTFSGFVQSQGYIHYYTTLGLETDADISVEHIQFDRCENMTRLSATFEVLSPGTVAPRFEEGSDNLLRVAGLMLNKGPIALPWNYAKEDLEDRFADIESQIVGGGLKFKTTYLVFRRCIV